MNFIAFWVSCRIGFGTTITRNPLVKLPLVHILNAFGQFSVLVLLLTSTAMKRFPDYHFWNITLSIIFSFLLIAFWQLVCLPFQIRQRLNLATRKRQRIVMDNTIHFGMVYFCANTIALLKGNNSQEPQIVYNLFGFMCFYTCHMFTNSLRKGLVTR